MALLVSMPCCALPCHSVAMLIASRRVRQALRQMTYWRSLLATPIGPSVGWMRLRRISSPTGTPSDNAGHQLPATHLFHMHSPKSTVHTRIFQNPKVVRREHPKIEKPEKASDSCSLPMNSVQPNSDHMCARQARKLHHRRVSVSRPSWPTRLPIT